jgi:hypothetical protein
MFMCALQMAALVLEGVPKRRFGGTAAQENVQEGENEKGNDGSSGRGGVISTFAKMSPSG